MGASSCEREKPIFLTHEPATMNKPSLFLVRAVLADSSLEYYATKDQDEAPGFSPFSGDEGPLQQSRFRNLVRQFSSQDEADQFLKTQSEHSLKRFSAVARPRPSVTARLASSSMLRTARPLKAKEKKRFSEFFFITRYDARSFAL